MTTETEEYSTAFRTYGVIVPLILSLILELLKYSGHFHYSWFWVFSPLWTWVCGVFQLFIAGFIYEMKNEMKNLKAKK